MVMFPRSPKEGKVEELKGRLMALRDKVDKILSKLRRVLLKLNGEDALIEELNRIEKEAIWETSALQEKVLQKIYEAEHGRGELRIVSFNPPKVHRLLFIGDENRKPKRPEEMVDYTKVLWKGEIKPPAWCNFAEVGLENAGTTRQEWDEFFERLKLRYGLSYIKEALPIDFVPTFKLGEQVSFGSCDHHSGSISCLGVVLPTGRFAVFIKYEKEGDPKPVIRFFGATGNYKWEASLSARKGTLNNSEDLSPLTEEEEAYMISSLRTEFPGLEFDQGEGKSLILIQVGEV